MANEYDIAGILRGTVNGRDGQDSTAKTTSEFQTAWEQAEAEALRHLRNIDKNVEEMLKSGIPMSQGAAKDASTRRRDREDSKDTDRRNNATGTPRSSKQDRSLREDYIRRPDSMEKGQRFRHDGRDHRPPEYANGKDSQSRWQKELGDIRSMSERTSATFFNTLEDQFLENLGFFDLTSSLKDSFARMSDSLGVPIEDVGPELGRIAATSITDKFAQTDLGKGLKEKVSGVFSKISGGFSNMADRAYSDLAKSPEDVERINLNRQNRQADEREEFFENYSQDRMSGKTTFQEFKTGATKDSWQSALDWMKGSSSQQAANIRNATRNQAQGTSRQEYQEAAGLSDDTSILATGQVTIQANSVMLSASGLSPDNGFESRNEYDDLVTLDEFGNVLDSGQPLGLPEHSSADDSYRVDTPSLAEGSQSETALSTEVLSTLGDSSNSAEMGEALGEVGGQASTALSVIGSAADNLGEMVSSDMDTPEGEKQFVESGGELVEDVGTELVTQAGSQAISGLLTSVGAPIPPELIAMIVGPIIDATIGPILNALGQALAKLFGPVVDAFQDYMEEVGDAFNRMQKSATKNQEFAQKRYADDVKELIEEPFNILQDAAQRMYEVWDSQLRKINATQGYDKAGLQDLISDYAERLRREGLASAIGASDITNNMSRVLDSGMSGAIAEEFAYIATKLNAAIPTQDFFSYSDTYVSLASQAMQAGASQTDAIAYATSQLESFAGGILYANRTLTGGFTTGLQDASNLFKQANQIAQSAKTSNASQIANVLSAVSGIVGGVAPDLASSLVDAVYNAAVGGNDSSIVALRSLAGINASNTEFLKEFASDPKKVFADMFSGFAELQNMSQDNYMEVAEALASTFGVSMDAIARVDFNYLARAIENMDDAASELSENVSHLASGETTTSKEAYRLAQVNEYMIDEGLSYVLDNQVARSIQEHMWQEQIAREQMEATYAVELQGAALSFLQTIMNLVDTLATILNPFRLISKIGDLLLTAGQNYALQGDIKQTLILGNVGIGNPSAYHDLVTRNADLNLAPSYIHTQGGVSAYEVANGLVKLNQGINELTNPAAVALRATESALNGDLLGVLTGGLSSTAIGRQVTQGLAGLTSAASAAIFSSRDSKYSWGSLSKSSANALSNSNLSGSIPGNTESALGIVSQAVTSASEAAQQKANEKLAELVGGEYIKENFVSQGKTYEDWVRHARTKGFSDVDAALNAAGWTADDVKGQFEAAKGQMGSDIAAEIEAEEKKMRQIIIVNVPLIQEYLLKQQEFQEWQRNEAWEQAVVWGQNIQSTLGDPNETSLQELLGSTDNEESVIGLLHLINESVSNEKGGGLLQTLLDHKALLDAFKNEMVNYVVKHDVYNAALNGSGDTGTSWYNAIKEVQNAEKNESSSAIYALVDALTANMVDLKDPQVAGNALLAQILKVLQVMATAQAGNMGGSSSLADSLIGLALGYTPTTSPTTGPSTLL